MTVTRNQYAHGVTFVLIVSVLLAPLRLHATIISDLDTIQKRVSDAVAAGQFDQAHIWLQHWKRLQPNSTQRQRDQARVYLELGAVAAALELAVPLLARTDDASVHFELKAIVAQALHDSGNHLAAFNHYIDLASDASLSALQQRSATQLARASLAPFLERKTWKTVEEWLGRTEENGDTPTPEAALLLLRKWAWIDPSAMPKSVLHALDAYPENPELAVAFVENAKRYDLIFSFADRAESVMRGPGFAKLPLFVQDQVRADFRRMYNYAQGVGAMSVEIEYDPIEDDDEIRYTRLDQIVTAIDTVSANLAQKYPTIQQRVERLKHDVNELHDRVFYLSEKREAITANEMERLGQAITRLREREQALVTETMDEINAIERIMVDTPRLIHFHEQEQPDDRKLRQTADDALATFQNQLNETYGPVYEAKAGRSLTSASTSEWVQLWLHERPRMAAQSALAEKNYQKVMDATTEYLFMRDADIGIWRLRRNAAIELGDTYGALHAGLAAMATDEDEHIVAALMTNFLQQVDNAADAAQAAYDAEQLEYALERLDYALALHPLHPGALKLQMRIAHDAQDYPPLLHAATALWSSYIDVDFPLDELVEIARNHGAPSLADSLQHGRVTHPAEPVRPSDVWVLGETVNLSRSIASKMAPGQLIELHRGGRIEAPPPGAVLRVQTASDGYGALPDLTMTKSVAKKPFTLVELKRLALQMFGTLRIPEGGVLTLERASYATNINLSGALLLENSVLGGSGTTLYSSKTATLHAVSSNITDQWRVAPFELYTYDSHIVLRSTATLLPHSRWNMSHSSLSALSAANASLVVKEDSQLIFDHVDFIGWSPSSIDLSDSSIRLTANACRNYGSSDFIRGRSYPSDIVTTHFEPLTKAARIKVSSIGELTSALRTASAGDWIELAAGDYRVNQTLHVPDGVGIRTAPKGKAIFRQSIKRHIAAFEVSGSAFLHGIHFKLEHQKSRENMISIAYDERPNYVILVRKGGCLLASHLHLDIYTLVENQYAVYVEDGATARIAHSEFGGTLRAGHDAYVELVNPFWTLVHQKTYVTGPGKVRLGLSKQRYHRGHLYSDRTTTFLGPTLMMSFEHGAGDAPLKEVFAQRMAARPKHWENARNQFGREFLLADSLASRKAATVRFARSVRKADPTLGDNNLESDKYIVTHLGQKLVKHIPEVGPLTESIGADTRIRYSNYYPSAVSREWGAYISTRVAMLKEENATDQAFEDALAFFRRIEPGSREAAVANNIQANGGNLAAVKAAVQAEREEAAARASRKQAALTAATERWARAQARWQEAERRRVEQQRRQAAWRNATSVRKSWYTPSPWKIPDRPSKPQSWSSKYLSSDAQMRDYRQDLDRSIFGTRR